jgi:hypothetical protein
MGDKKFDREYYLKCLQEVIRVCENLDLVVNFCSPLLGGHYPHHVSTERMMNIRDEYSLMGSAIHIFLEDSFIYRIYIRSELLYKNNFLETFESEVCSVLLDYIFT